MIRRNYFLLLLFLSTILLSQNQNKHNQFIKKIYKTALSKGKSYNWLDHLSNQIGGRLSGSLNAKRAIQWSKEELDLLKIDNVNLSFEIISLKTTSRSFCFCLFA